MTKKLSLHDPAILLGLQDEVQRSDESRYTHRIDALILIAQGKSCREVAAMYGHSPRAVQYWVTRFEKYGLQGIAEGDREGRPSRLTEEQKEEIRKVLKDPPEQVGLTGGIWDGKTLSAYIQASYGVKIGVRQCQRMFRALGFRLRKPRPLIASADPDAQEAYKKTQDTSE
jgi:transposase